MHSCASHSARLPINKKAAGKTVPPYPINVRLFLLGLVGCFNFCANDLQHFLYIISVGAVWREFKVLVKRLGSAVRHLVFAILALRSLPHHERTFDEVSVSAVGLSGTGLIASRHSSGCISSVVLNGADVE